MVTQDLKKTFLHTCANCSGLLFSISTMRGPEFKIRIRIFFVGSGSLDLLTFVHALCPQYNNGIIWPACIQVTGKHCNYSIWNVCLIYRFGTVKSILQFGNIVVLIWAGRTRCDNACVEWIRSVWGICLHRHHISYLIHFFKKKIRDFLHTCTTCPELPSNISTLANGEANEAPYQILLLHKMFSRFTHE